MDFCIFSARFKTTLSIKIALLLIGSREKREGWGTVKWIVLICRSLEAKLKSLRWAGWQKRLFQSLFFLFRSLSPVISELRKIGNYMMPLPLPACKIVATQFNYFFFLFTNKYKNYTSISVLFILKRREEMLF